MNDEFEIDPKVAQDMTEKAYEMYGVKSEPVFRDDELYFTSKSQQELIAESIKEILHRTEQICCCANLYTNKFIDIYKDILVDRGVDEKLAREFFRAGFLDACYRFHLDIERIMSNGQ